MGKQEFSHRLKTEPASIHTASQQELLSTIACEGFKKSFDLGSFNLTQKKVVEVHEGLGEDQMGTILKRDGKKYRVHFIRDLDNYGVIVTDESNENVVTKVVLRERSHDGSFESGSPQYLKIIDGLSEEQIPERSRHIGFTNWSYAEKNDIQEPGVKSLELSVISSDPDRVLLDQLLKKNRLFVNPRELAKFIDDPFAYIPFNEVSEKTINLWWKYWFQVADRGMRGKEIPQPGQTSQRGFDGFFSNTLQTTEVLAKKTGHTHLTAIPTWTYVWHAFIERGYKPTDMEQYQETIDFMERIGSVILSNDKPVSTLSPKHPLASWLSVAPFVLQLNPDFVPTLGIDPVREKRFQELYTNLKNAVQSNGEVKTYPFSPGRSLWLSKKL